MHYYICKEKPAVVTAQFEDFNSNFHQLEQVFKEITGTDFLPGRQQFTQVLHSFPVGSVVD